MKANRRTHLLFLALGTVPLASIACTTDDGLLGPGGAGIGGSTTESVTIGPGGAGGQGAADPCVGVDCTDTNPCTDDACVDGACPHPFSPIDTPCNGTGVCDARGNCGCNTTADCGSAACGMPTCTGNPKLCGWNLTDAGMVVADDGTTGNCMAMVCDGLVETSAIGNDDQDAPADASPMDCQVPQCTAGVLGMTSKPDGTACDDAGAEAGGQCAGGSCVDCTTTAGCVGGNVCITGNICCTPMTMATACVGVLCGSVSDGCGGLIVCAVGLCS